MKRWFPWIITGIFALWILAAFRLPGPKNGYDVTGFGQLPALLNGRVQPLDSVARNSLLQIRAKQSVALFEPGAPWYRPPKIMSASEWLLEVFARPELADTREIFRIDFSELQGMLNLSTDRKHFAYNELKPKLDDLEKEARRINEVEGAKRTVFERQIMRLYNAVMIYTRLKLSVQPEGTKDFQALLQEFATMIGPGKAAMQARESGQTYDKALFEKFMGQLQEFNRVQQAAYPLLCPPADPAKSRDNWISMGQSLMEIARDGKTHPATGHYAAMMTAVGKNDAAAFNQAVAAYRQWLGPQHQPEMRKSRHEFFFSHMEAFYKVTIIYVFAFILAVLSLINLTDWLRRSAFNLVLLAWVVHSIGLAYRMILEGRPPVTNLYSSAVFIGWGTVFLGVVLERFFPISLGVLAAAAVGFVTQIIAHNLALGGDTMEMMRAVLDHNFWLATHVITVTLGYSATFFAGFLAVMYVFLGFFTRNLTQDMARALSRMVYAITCFATLFSFIGTVLGGIWADQSWGRFWGWDPKENGALLIVIWTAIYLHARWGGILKERGLMNVAIFGNIVTAWSWFGVNMLGVGLHSYGFMDSAFKWLLLFVGSQLLLIGLSLLPVRYWGSAAHLGEEQPTDPTPEIKPDGAAPT